MFWRDESQKLLQLNDNVKICDPPFRATQYEGNRLVYNNSACVFPQENYLAGTCTIRNRICLDVVAIFTAIGENE